MINAGILFAASALFICLAYFTKRGRHLPPGPPTLPFIGNLHLYPRVDQRRAHAEWHRKYGPIISLKLGGKVVIVLGNYHVARELLDKRGSIYSSRPRMVMAGECVTKGLNTALLPYNSRWKIHNRLQTALLNPRAVENYREVQDIESKQLLYEMLMSNDFSSLFTRYSASILFALAYGKRLTRGDEHEIREIKTIAKNFIESILSGTWLVDVFPTLNRLPPLLAPWKRIGDQFYERTIRLFDMNTNAAMGTDSWNWTKQIRTLREAENIPPEDLSYLVGVLYEAGIDTTTCVLEVFVMASVLHPAAVQQAQRELDEVVGSSRPPTLDDMKNLPYVNAFIKEVLRWRPLIPGGIPHAVTEDDNYEGYHIPRGAVVIANHWSIHLDEDVFADPAVFRPDRWIENPGLPLNAFGFGRRACVGQHLALNSLEMAICRILWAFDFDHVYENGQRMEIDSWNMTQEGVLLRPHLFGYPSASAISLAMISYKVSGWAKSDPQTDSILECVAVMLISALIPLI